MLGGNRPWHFYMSVTTFSYIVDFKDACTADSPGNWRQRLPPDQKADLFPDEDIKDNADLRAKFGPVCQQPL